MAIKVKVSFLKNYHFPEKYNFSKTSTKKISRDPLTGTSEKFRGELATGLEYLHTLRRFTYHYCRLNNVLKSRVCCACTALVDAEMHLQ